MQRHSNVNQTAPADSEKPVSFIGKWARLIILMIRSSREAAHPKEKTVDGGFINPRTGKYVSPMRAHQHVGESIAGYEKAISASTGNFYMRPTAPIGLAGPVSCYSEMSSAALQALIMQSYAPLYASAMKSLAKSLEESTRQMRIDSKEMNVKAAYEGVLTTLSSCKTVKDLCKDAVALSRITALIPKGQINLIGTAKNVDYLKQSCHYVLQVLDEGASELLYLKCKMDLSLTEDEEKEEIIDRYRRLDAMRSDRLEAFSVMRQSPATAEERESAIETFWQTIDGALEILDEATWKRKKFREANLLADNGSLEQSIEILQRLGDYPGAGKKRAEVARALEEFRNAEKYKAAEKLLAEGEYRQSIQAFRSLGNWGDAKKRLALAESEFSHWKEVTYCYAIKQFDDGEYLTAANNFEKLGDFLDARARAKDSRHQAQLVQDYESADRAEKSGDLEKAAAAFAKLGSFRDSELRAESCRRKFEENQRLLYATGTRDFTNGLYGESIKSLEKLGDYLDAKELLEKARLHLKQEETLRCAIDHFRKGRFSQAMAEVLRPTMDDVCEAKDMAETIRAIDAAERELSSYLQKESSVKERLKLKKREYRQIETMKRPKVPSQRSLEIAEKRAASLEAELAQKGFFAFKEKKLLRSKLEKTRSEISQFRECIPQEQSQQEANITARLSSIAESIDAVSQELQTIRAATRKLRRRLKSLKAKY